MIHSRLLQAAALAGSLTALAWAPTTQADVKLNGSGAGIQDLINGVVYFAASDAAMKDDDKAAALRKLVDYCTSEQAQGQADGLGYIPLPAGVIEKVRAAGLAGIEAV